MPCCEISTFLQLTPQLRWYLFICATVFQILKKDLKLAHWIGHVSEPQLMSVMTSLYPEKLGLVTGSFELAASISSTVGPLLGGFVYQNHGFAVASTIPGKQPWPLNQIVLNLSCYIAMYSYCLIWTIIKEVIWIGPFPSWPNSISHHRCPQSVCQHWGFTIHEPERAIWSARLWIRR